MLIFKEKRGLNMIRVKINPDFYTTDTDGQVNGWSATSPFKKTFPDYLKFVLTVGKSADLVAKSNYAMTDETFGGTRAITVNHIGAEMTDAVFHTLVNNMNQYDYVIQILDFMSRLPAPYIRVYKDGVEMTQADVAGFTIVP
jgi:hypothetical protein